eukprot:gene1241-1820_t
MPMSTRKRGQATATPKGPRVRIADEVEIDGIQAAESATPALLAKKLKYSGTDDVKTPAASARKFRGVKLMKHKSKGEYWTASITGKTIEKKSAGSARKRRSGVIASQAEVAADAPEEGGEESVPEDENEEEDAEAGKAGVEQGENQEHEEGEEACEKEDEGGYAEVAMEGCDEDEEAVEEDEEAGDDEDDEDEEAGDEEEGEEEVEAEGDDEDEGEDDEEAEGEDDEEAEGEEDEEDEGDEESAAVRSGLESESEDEEEEEEEEDEDAILRSLALSMRAHLAADSSSAGCSKASTMTTGSVGKAKRKKAADQLAFCPDTGISSELQMTGEEEVLVRARGGVPSGKGKGKALEGEAGLEAKLMAPPRNKAKEAKEARLKKPVTAGKGWFDLPAPEMTPELKKDLQLLRLRGTYDPKRFYKNTSTKLPKFFQMGRVVEGAADFYSSRLNKKDRKQTIGEELMADDSVTRYRKRRFKAVQDNAEYYAKQRKKGGHKKPRNRGARGHH